MWLGERITDRGIGNGISLIIMIGIIAVLPANLINEVTTKANAIIVLIEIAVLVLIIAAVVLLTQGTRKIQYNMPSVLWEEKFTVERPSIYHFV